MLSAAGTALTLSQIYHSEEKEKGCIAATLEFVGVPGWTCPPQADSNPRYRLES